MLIHFVEHKKNYAFKNTALHLAASKGNIEIIQLLIESRNIDVNIKNKILF